MPHCCFSRTRTHTQPGLSTLHVLLVAVAQCSEIWFVLRVNEGQTGQNKQENGNEIIIKMQI